MALFPVLYLFYCDFLLQFTVKYSGSPVLTTKHKSTVFIPFPSGINDFTVLFFQNNYLLMLDIYQMFTFFFFSFQSLFFTQVLEEKLMAVTIF